MPRRLAGLFIAAITVGLLAAVPALAALGSEVSAGRSVAARCRAAKRAVRA